MQGPPKNGSNPPKISQIALATLKKNKIDLYNFSKEIV